MKDISPRLVVGLLVFIVFTLGIGAISFRSRCVALEAGLKARQTAAMVSHSQMVTELTNEAQVHGAYRRDTMAAIDRVVQARTGTQSETVRAIVEANPTINSETATRLMRSINERRTAFAESQDALVDLKREYESYRNGGLGPVYNAIWGFPHMDVDAATRIVLAPETREAFATGSDATVNLPLN